MTSRGAYPTFKYVQVNARFAGIDFSSGLQVSNRLQLLGKYSTVRAYDRNINSHLEFIPADKFGLDAVFNFESIGKFKKSTLDFGASHTTRQDRILQTQDYAATPAAYTLFSMDLSANVNLFKKSVGFSLTVQNLTNEVYRDYLNRFRYFADEQGRNFILRTRIPI